MEIYLPIAEISQNIFFLLSIGFVAGILSGMFGVGGGFMTTPILILGGVPPAIAVGSEANHIVGSSLTGFLNYFRRKNVDTLMGLILLIGGVLGSTTGVYLFRFLAVKGRIEEVISFAYILFLAILSLVYINTVFARIAEHGTDRSALILIFVMSVIYLKSFNLEKNEFNHKYFNNFYSKLALLFAIIISLKSFYIIYLVSSFAFVTKSHTSYNFLQSLSPNY